MGYCIGYTLSNWERIFMAELKYKRTLLKISGESLKGDKEHGYDAEAVRSIVKRVKEALDMGAQIALVVGAGNIWRGLAGSQGGMDRVTADHMGMLATVMNALCLKDAFTSAGIPCHVHAASDLTPFAPRFDRDKALAQLDKGDGMPLFHHRYHGGIAGFGDQSTGTSESDKGQWHLYRRPEKRSFRRKI